MEPPFPAYKGEDPYIFVCYSHADTDAVYGDIALLRSKGLNIWYDEGLSPGTEWSEELGLALEKSSHLLFYVSKSSASSRHCRDEVHFAQNHDKPVVTIYLEDVELPVGLELSLGSTQAIQKFNLSDDNYVNKIARVLPGVTGTDESVKSKQETGPSRDDTPHFRRYIWRYMAGFAGILAGLVILNRNLLLASAIIYLPVLFPGTLEQEIGFATARDDVRIAYATTGQGPPVLIVLGWATHLQKGFNSPMYDGQGVLAMSSKNHTIIRYDGRGFGLSDRDVSDYSIDARVSDIEAVVDALGIDKFALYAMSAGGPAGIAYTHKHPDKVVSLTLASTQASFQHVSKERLESFARMLALFETSWQSPAVTNLMVDIIASEADDVERRVIGEFLRRAAEGPAMYGFFTEHMNIDVSERAKEITTPTLVIHGRDDTTIPLEAGRILASLIPGVKFEIVEGGHGPGTGATPETRQIILDFIDSIPST
jgi:pimeloyl-ACP methyl ester carboxylesterase